MIRRTIPLLFAISFILSLCSCKAEIGTGVDQPEIQKPKDFMQADWGMDRAGIQKAMLPNKEIYADESYMLYEVDKEYDIFQVLYYFIDDHLVEGECRIEMGTEVWSKRVPEMIESYVTFRSELIELYGNPLEEDYRIWIDKIPEYENDDDMHNLYYNRIEYLSEWETEYSIMTLRLFYKDRDFRFLYEASSKG